MFIIYNKKSNGGEGHEGKCVIWIIGILIELVVLKVYLSFQIIGKRISRPICMWQEVIDITKCAHIICNNNNNK